MYGQMTAGSWIYIGSQGILQGTYETLVSCAKKHFGGSLEGRILLTSGAGKDFATLARPKDVQIVFSDKSSTRLTLKDDPNPTQYDFSSHVVSSFAEIHILSVYPSAQSPDVAIAEVEFFKIE